MSIHDYLIDQADYDWPNMLSDWSWLLPESLTIWLVNRFGDIFLVYDDDSVHFLDVGSGELKKVAIDRDDFASKIDESDNANFWLMISLVDDCVATGLHLSPGQVYSFVKPPLLGGEYSIQNVEVTDLAVHYSVTGQIAEQTKDLPDGTKVNIKLREGT